ncbi:hypothetical protein DFJ58DRAFT_846843 [Suillus subalutaceus]|uniref:uncharacterized protein n=1 Tax=Suillus subalutaceus TaxID=48586 RepID=UPI001B8659D6|nr:uncharacterized protein DFJ58DRAFT_846843 [Suillus subalutaceus]KAG1836694.1 hypothetical protein DFJ58DRAFT_846843 [Suillus subalutaceus]
MSPEERRRLEALAQQQAGSNTFDMDYDNDNTDFGNILDGTHTIEISHAGGEFEDLAREIYGDFWTPDRIKRRVDAFDQQMFGLTDACLKWNHERAQHGFRSFLEVHRTHQSHVDPNSGSWDVQVVDIYYAEKVSVTIASTDHFVASALVHHELYRVAWLRNPHFSIQAFVKSICDLHGVEHSDEENPCTGRWKNMDDEKTKRSWGLYDETGIFLAVCRHGFCLLIADMVQSGELAKYPLSIVAKLLDAFGTDLGSEYDIGCQFKTTLDNSALGPLTRSLNHTCLVGAFHGYAHEHLCQLYHLTTYVSGLGLEDLKTCECTFSKSNALVSTLRYASVFHHQQLIAAYFEHNDEYEVYPSLGNFLYNNYKQALDILSDGEIILKKLMQDIHIPDESVFEWWLQEERDYLHGLCMNLTASQNNLDSARSIWASATPSSASFGTTDTAATRRIETARRHTLELFEKDLATVQELNLTSCSSGSLKILSGKMLDSWLLKEDTA